LLALLLLVFGAKRLPDMGRSLGSGLRGFKESLSGEPSPAATGELGSGEESERPASAERNSAV
jgi:TatA/E family protein of Tat protein translocase